MDQAMECYLKARELHLMFTPQTNIRARELFLQAINLDGSLHRAKGHLAFSRMHAWLYGWGDINLATDVRDLAWSALYGAPYGTKTTHDGVDDYDNWWSVGVALLYYAAAQDDAGTRSDIFSESITHYQGACSRAWPDKNDPATMVAIREDLADLLADYAEALYFRGDGTDIQDALNLLDEAKELSGASHPRWHDWNRAWAWYERGHELEQSNQAKSEHAYLQAIDLLTSMTNLPHQYRRTLAVCYAALGWYDDARREGRQFLERERLRGHAYDPGIETRWPYKDRTRGAKLRERLRKAGIPAPV